METREFSGQTETESGAIKPRGYTLEPEAASQLSTFEDASPADVAEMLFGRAAAQSNTRICEEVLVTLLRRNAAAGDEKLAWRIAAEITQRVKGRIARTLTLWRLDQPESTAEDVIDEILTATYEALFDLSERERFWEIRFWVAFDRRLIKIARAKRTLLDTSQPQLPQEDELSHTQPAGASNVFGAPSLQDPVDAVLAGEALALLSPNERTAFLLKHVAGMPEHSEKQNGPVTIAQVLNVSPRTIRNYLARAEKTLAEWRNPSSAEYSISR